VIVLPDVPNSQASPVVVSTPMRTDVEFPTASVICDAIVRRQISSYRRWSSVDSSPLSWSGVRKTSPAGRIASCASWAFFTLRA